MLNKYSCRSEIQKEKTKHIDKFKRVVCEAIKAKYPNTTDEVLKDKVVTGMNGHMLYMEYVVRAQQWLIYVVRSLVAQLLVL